MLAIFTEEHIQWFWFQDRSEMIQGIIDKIVGVFQVIIYIHIFLKWGSIGNERPWL